MPETSQTLDTTTFRETNINFLEKCKVCNLFGQSFKQNLALLKVESGLGTLAMLAFHHKVAKSTECCNIKVLQNPLLLTTFNNF